MVFVLDSDTVAGEFGDGESKIVRNLTKPPMVNSIIEFVSEFFSCSISRCHLREFSPTLSLPACMHARKLKPEDTKTISPNKPNSKPAEGYIVVSRAVNGGKWSADDSSNNNSNGEKYIRNDILLGVNLLKAVPGEPDKTELTAVTHVYSPLLPLMLAKNAGVKGAVDFVRDIRALP